MSVTDWFRRLFAPPSKADSSDPAPPDYMAGDPGVSSIAELETAQAVEGVEESTEAPSDY